MNRSTYFSLILYVLCNSFVYAETEGPSGHDLLKACRASVKNGFEDMEGWLCHWYVTPCDCHQGKEIPRVCLPAGISDEKLASIVIEGLQADKSLLEKEAALAANSVLIRYYPCPN